MPTDSIAAGEPFDLVIESSTPAHRGIAFPSATNDSAFGDLEVLSRTGVRTRRVGGGYAIDSVAYTVRSTARDSVYIPPVPIRVDVAVGTLTTFTEPRTVWVASARDGAASPPLPTEPSGSPGRWMLIGLLLACIGGGVYLWGRYRREHWGQETTPSQELPETDTESTAYKAAARRVQALQSSDLSTPEAIESFYVTLAGILHTYLSRRWEIETKGRTTQELVSALDQQVNAPPVAVERLRRVLKQADRVKFAGDRPGPSTAEETLQTAQSALDTLEAAAAPEDGTGDSSPSADSDAASR
jgi:hypothetical protein